MNYVLPNRKGFSDFVTRLFLKYRDKETDPESKTRELFSYQKIVREYLLMETPYRGLLLYHGLGSGKTCSSIAVAESLLSTKKIYILLPASLQANYRTEIRKCGDPIFAYEQHWEKRDVGDKTEAHNLSISDDFLDKNRKYYVTIPGRTPNFKDLSKPDQDTIKKQIDDILDQRFKFINYNGISAANVERILPADEPNQFDDCVIIIDEAHNLIGNVVNEREVKRKLYDRIYHAKRTKIVALSGTPIINRPNEIAFLLNLLRGPIERVTIPTKNAVSWDEGMMTSFLKKLPDVDTIEYNSVKRSIMLTRNPPDFETVYNDKNERTAVKYHKDEKYIPDIRDWAFSWRSKFEAEFGTEFVDKEKLVVEELECLPSKYEDFAALFLEGLTFKNAMLFQRRIQGLVSYFKGAAADLVPKRIDEEDTLQKVPLSPEQYLRYLEIRWEEIQKEARKGAKPSMNEEFGSFRMLSRLVCNYAIPPEMKVPEADTENEENAVDKSEILAKLKADPEKYLSDKALKLFSPKMLKMLKDLKKNMNGKLINQFVYSQYISLEGLGVFSAILEHNGFQEYKLVKTAGVWAEDPAMDKRPAFAFFKGGTSDKDKELRELYLQIYNGKYEDTFPQSLKDSIQEKRLCVLLVSSAGAEGISLIGTRNVYIMEPYWNPARIDQVIGRAIRINSHKDLPEEERTVKVQLYMTVFSPEQTVSPEGPNIVSIRRNDMVLKRYEGETPQETFMTSDEFLYEVAFEKTKVIKQVSHLLKQAAVDCEIHRKLHSSERPVIQCMKFDTTYSPDDLGYKPATLTEERDVLYKKNITRRGRRLQKVLLKETLIIFDPDTNEVFDAPIFEDSERLLKIGMREGNMIRFFV